MTARELAPDEVYRTCDPESFDFQTTADLEPLVEVMGQPRAVAAVEFGLAIERGGYNLFALGPPGTGRRTLVRRALERCAREKPPPFDWCYVQDFDEPQKPRAIRLPAGMGVRLRDDMEHLVENLRSALTSALESEEYQTRRQMIEDQLTQRQSAALEEVGKRAERHGLRMTPSPAGIVLAPVRDGRLLPPDELQRLPDEKRAELERAVEQLQTELQKGLRQMPRWQREQHEAVRELNRQVTRFAAGALIEELRERYRDEARVGEYLDAVEADVVEHAREFAGRTEGQQPGSQAPSPGPDGENPFLRRYRVNVVVDNRGAEGAPIVHVDHPTHANLVGRIEQLSRLGALVTDFNLIRAGALHRANGGYLVLDVLELLRQPLAWPALKRALRARCLRIESMAEAFSLIHTVSLEPEPIPLEVKVILVGEPFYYHLLSELDPDFQELFKVAADFADSSRRSAETEQDFARLVARLAREQKLRPFAREAVSRGVEHAARLAGDAERLSIDVGAILDMLCEADHWAGQSGHEIVQRGDVDRALEQRIYRADRPRERLQEEMLRETLEIATEGSAVGQINGLSVLQRGDFAFGRPSRITARVRLGAGEVVNIEREVKLSGPFHSKGVLILAGFLGERYAAETPLSLSASLVFEQSYSGVDGDSASSAELYALLSAIAGVPIRQSLAVTGAVNQHGRLQAVGGINEKIEAFFDLCQARGLNGEQGVVIPAANTVHLMLRPAVVEAVETSRFHVHVIDSIDDGIELLTGLAAGERDEDGIYPEESFNHRVQAHLESLARRRKDYAHGSGGSDS